MDISVREADSTGGRRSGTVSDELEIRRASQVDLPNILALARRALGWTDADASFLRWKHFENPFGESPMWIALDRDEVVGFRTFLRWNFTAPNGSTVRAVRAVDTATDPDHQGRGIFTRLTLDAIDALAAEGVTMIFNTPNSKSLPGYLKMGWEELGRLQVAVMPTSWRFPVVIGTARQAAGRLPFPTRAGESLNDIFESAELDELLDEQPSPPALHTVKSRAFLAWRYGNAELGYRVVLTGSGKVKDGVAVFRRRCRGRAIEGVICDVLAPRGDKEAARALIRRVARAAAADYVLRIDRRFITADPFVGIPRVGPVLTCRSLDMSPTPRRDDFSLSMGDIELF
jgi:GNAT superfamily N-acetyltransferase